MAFKKGCVPWNKDKELPEKMRKNMGLAVRKRRDNGEILGFVKGSIPWNKNKKGIYTKEVIELMRNYRLGKKHTEDEKRKIGNGSRKNWERKELRIQMSERQKGEKNHNWKNGLSFGNYGIEFTKDLKTTVRKRDKFTCQICFKNGFCVHHKDYNKKNNNLNNLVTLCRHCHTMTNYNRDYWKNYPYGRRI